MVILSSFFDFEFVSVGNFWYFFFIVTSFALTWLSLALCHHYGKKFARIFILVLLWGNFALHFLKQFLPYWYNSWPYTLADSLGPNLCAILIVTAPFIFLFGNDYFKDYFFYIGLISGVAVHFYPTGTMDHASYPGGFFSNPNYYIAVIRFYFCHLVLIITSLLSVEQGFHKLNYKRLWAVPLIYALYLAGVSFNAILLGPILHHPYFPQDWIGADGVLNFNAKHASIANQSMNFGPQPFLDGIIRPLYRYFLPLGVFQIDGDYYFVPVLWQIPFIYLGALIAGPLMCLPFDYAHMKRDFLGFKQRRKLRKLSR